MAMTDEQYKARIAFLKSQVADVLLPRAVYDKISWLVQGMIQHFEDIDPAIFDLEEARVREIGAALSKPISVNGDQKVKLSLLDLFDMENISLLAERDLKPFAGAAKCDWKEEDAEALTGALEKIRKTSFPQERKASGNG
jgi:hypothetical protein